MTAAVGNPLRDKFLELHVGRANGSSLGLMLVMTDADWAGDVKGRKRYSGVAAWVKSNTKETWYPVYASSKTQKMICLSSGRSPLVTNGARCVGAHRERLSCVRAVQQLSAL